MSSATKINIAYGLAVICLLTGIFCYSFSPAKQTDQQPVRLFFPSVGGNVLFDHQVHSEAYDLSCTECHHTVAVDQPHVIESCNSCHQPESSNLIVFGNNGSFDHTMHSEDIGLSCSECHHDYSEDDSEDPQPCSNCHKDENESESIPGRTVTFHAQCIGCHEDNSVTPGEKNCSGCHAPRKTMAAFHDQCTGCHEDMGSGPINQDSDCNYCHGF